MYYEMDDDMVRSYWDLYTRNDERGTESNARGDLYYRKSQFERALGYYKVARDAYNVCANALSKLNERNINLTSMQEAVEHKIADCESAIRNSKHKAV